MSETYLISIASSLVIFSWGAVYLLGYFQGYRKASRDAVEFLKSRGL